MNIFKKGLYILSWIPPAAIKLFLALVGLVTVKIAVERYGDNSDWWPKFFWVWGNDQEGYPEWAENRDISAWHWYAIRNPVNNSRFIFEDRAFPMIDTNIAGGDMEKHDLEAAGQSSAYRWTYDGPFAGYRRTWLKKGKFSELYFGWKVGSSVPGLGFTAQVRLNREE